MIRYIIGVTILAACYWVGAATTAGGIDTPLAADRQMVNVLRGDVQRNLTRRCMGNPFTPYRYPDVRRIPSSKVRAILVTWRHRKVWVRNQRSRCGSSPAAVIRQVFRATSWAALRVAECESHMSPRAVGAAGERGLFQIHPVHFSWLDEARLFEARYNSQIAFRMSRGGTNWSAWTCKP